MFETGSIGQTASSLERYLVLCPGSPDGAFRLPDIIHIDLGLLDQVD